MRTLNAAVSLSGKGLHSGQPCTLTISPCMSPNVMISRGKDEYPLPVLKYSGTNRGTDCIFPSGEVIRTCEHVFSALSGLGIYSGVKISVDGEEMPALDGCSREVCASILSLSHEDGNPVQAAEVTRPVMVSNDDGTRFAAAFPSDVFRITYGIEFDTIGAQIYDYGADTDYFSEISPARTFAYEREIEYLRSRGLALGGTPDNAILIGEKIQAKGGLHWPNEFARHKVLDIIGDLSTIGCPLKAHIIAVRAGHELHLRLAEKLKGDIH